MILYLDTSALVKLYVEEPGSRAVAVALERATAAATARVSYVEARSALARHAHAGGLTRAELRRVVRQLDDEWGRFVLVELTDAVVRRAGALAERHRLGAYDAVQLASALDVRSAGGEVEFSCFDGGLERAARRERLPLAER